MGKCKEMREKKVRTTENEKGTN